MPPTTGTIQYPTRTHLPLPVEVCRQMPDEAVLARAGALVAAPVGRLCEPVTEKTPLATVAAVRCAALLLRWELEDAWPCCADCVRGGSDRACVAELATLRTRLEILASRALALIQTEQAATAHERRK